MITELTAQVTRDGRWWAVRVPELDKTTQVRRLADVEEYTRDLAELYEVPGAAELPVTQHVYLGDKLEHVQKELTRAGELLADAQRQEAEAHQLRQAAARDLAGRGLTVRDIGQLLGVSFQRAQQLVGAQAAT